MDPAINHYHPAKSPHKFPEYVHAFVGTYKLILMVGVREAYRSGSGVKIPGKICRCNLPTSPQHPGLVVGVLVHLPHDPSNIYQWGSLGVLYSWAWIEGDETHWLNAPFHIPPFVLLITVCVKSSCPYSLYKRKEKELKDATPLVRCSCFVG